MRCRVARGATRNPTGLGNIATAIVAVCTRWRARAYFIASNQIVYHDFSIFVQRRDCKIKIYFECMLMTVKGARS